MQQWIQVAPGLWTWHESCRVYLLKAPSGWVMINCGSGDSAKEMLESAPGAPTHILLTHHFREVSVGASVFKSLAPYIQIYAPESERFYLSDAEQHWRERNTWMLFDTRWDRKGPRESIPVDHWVADYSSPNIAGYTWNILPTPSVSFGATSLIVNHEGKTLAFTGDLLHSPGKVHRMAPLQYIYNDAAGLKNVYTSTVALEGYKPDLILPSAAEAILEPQIAIKSLQKNLQDYFCFIYGPQADLDSCRKKQIEQVLPWLYRSTIAATETTFIVGKTGKVACIDYGYDSNYIAPSVRDVAQWRPTLHSIPDLEKELGRKGIDAFFVTHHHDDHISGITLLQQLYKTQVFAAEEIVDILANPAAYDQQCLWHKPITAQGCRSGVWHEWDGLSFRFDPISGHSQYASLITFQRDDETVCHIGDQFFWRGGRGFNYGEGVHFFSNHVYLNGPRLGDYLRFVTLIEEFRPSLVLSGHAEPQRPDAKWYQKLKEGAGRWDDLHRTLMPLGESDAHSGVASTIATLRPYRTLLSKVQPFTVEAFVTNPLNTTATIELRLVGPSRWQCNALTITLPPRGEGRYSLKCIPAPGDYRRTPIALKLIVNGQPYGEVAEALVTIGHSEF